MVLRRFEAGDASALAAYRSDPDTARWQGWDAPFPLEAAQRFVTEVGAADPGVPGTAFQYALTLRDDARLVGDVMLATDPDPRQVDLGVTLAPGARGRGLATEALRIVLDHVLVSPGGVHRARASCDPRNTASVALWRRLGFRAEAHRVAAYWTGSEWVDDIEFAVLAEAWRESDTSPPDR